MNCVLAVLSIQSVCAKLGMAQTLDFGVMLGQEWLLGLRIVRPGKEEKNLGYILC